MPKEESYSTKVVLSDKVNIDISIQKPVKFRCPEKATKI
jgi:hypothetical protein